MPTAPHAQPLRVLVLEDDPFTRATVASSLRLHGLDVVAEVGTGGAAVRD